MSRFAKAVNMYHPDNLIAVTLKQSNMQNSYNLNYSDAYNKHQVFDEIQQILEYYEDVAEACLYISPNGTQARLNYQSYIYTAIQGTLESIQVILKIGHINDAYTLLRKYFDDVLMEIYISILREDKFDWISNQIVRDVDEGLTRKHRIPATNKILNFIKNSKNAKKIYPFFGWETYFKHNREVLNDCVHGNKYHTVILNCNKIILHNREKHLQNTQIVLKQVFTMHLAFIFQLTPQYMMASDYIYCHNCGLEPPPGSEQQIAPYTQRVFDKYIKPSKALARFVKANCYLNIQ